MHIDQWVGKVRDRGTGQGQYYQGEGQSDSPYFKMTKFDPVWHQYMQAHETQVFSLINFAFFETYRSTTQLAFPVKLNSRLITGGSSPFGPSNNAADERYRFVKLKALIWDENTVSIVDYDPESGSPLNSPTVENAIVTYRYSDHPAKILAQNPPNKYQLIGTLDKDGLPGDEWMLILTVNRATLDEGANLLRQLGARGEIVTADGGSSTLIMNSRTGVLIAPQPVNMVENPNAWKLPHYLGFRRKAE
ncbi:MAG: hypothetical protein SW833_03560 [Cyanobacteriota bacterium]|nr:hypothetical protein [Cyanobacteriota bacterium]